MDSFGLVYGGDKYMITNFEVLFPLVEKYGIRGLVFFDAGNTFAEGQNIDPSGFRTDVGPGIRWNSPFGPLRIEFGYVLDQRAGDRPYQFQFSAGAYFFKESKKNEKIFWICLGGGGHYLGLFC